ncbi:MAG: hypothetical protein IT269_00060, partial [Saprospiraceae bacterium]|nr:hypothetical protein [Saprospiraceae bacterium]
MKQLLLLLLLPILAFSACSKDDNDDDSTTDTGTPLIARRIFFQEPNGSSDDLQYSYDGQKRCTLINGVNVKFMYNYTSASDISVVIVPTATQDTAYRTILLKDGWASEQFYRTGNGPLAPERIYERNADHSVKKQTNYSVSNPGQINSVEEYEYDSDGNRTRALTFNKDGVL